MWGVISLLETVGALLVLTFVFRIIFSAEEKHYKKFIETWRHIIVESLVKTPENVPTIASRDIYPLLKLWNYFHESVRGAPKQRLNDFARKVGIDKFAERLLARLSARDKLIAMATLGHLRQKSVLPAIEQIAATDDPYISLVAVRAMMMIDPEESYSWLVEGMRSRSNWSPVRVALLLKEMGPDIAARSLTEVIQSAEGNNLRRVVGFLKLISPEISLPHLRSLLGRSEEEEIVATCLKTIGHMKSFEDVQLVRSFKDHSSHKVRAQVASALGILGTDEDQSILANLLGDRHYIVRRAAAESLARLPSSSMESLQQLATSLSDDYSRDILRQEIFRQYGGAG